ncbi:MAG: PD-(D/E)XK nuclease family protein [Candidatus Omnitrophota bacterium]
MERIVTYNLSEDLIEKLSCFIEDTYIAAGRDLSRVAVVFGGKRPALFLKRELSRRIKKGFAPPRFFSIDEFMEYSFSKRTTFGSLSDLDDCYMIYTLAQGIAGDILKGRESFSKFLPWAREVRAFIEQLDLEDIALKPLENIQYKASIGYDVPENINLLLTSIIAIRQAYHCRQRERNLYSRGMVYLSAAAGIGEADFPEFDRIIFAGFFYMHKTEERVIKHLWESRLATLLFQGDETDWSVLKKTAQDFSCSIQPRGKEVFTGKLSIQSGFDVHSQASLVREAVREIDDLDKTVIVLPAVEHVIPLLSEISSCVGDFNISMGYPLNRSALYSLFDCIAKAQETRKADKYYAKDYLNALSHPLVKNILILEHPGLARVLVHKIEEILLGIEKTSLGGSLFIGLQELEDSRELYELALSTMKSMGIEAGYDGLKSAVILLHGLLFSRWEGISDFQGFASALARFLECLINKSPMHNYPLNLKMAEKMFQVQEEFSNAAFGKEQFSRNDIFKIVKDKLDSEKISFSGSPLKGLQILGLFETRSLNFENVIIMDVNESMLPNLQIYEPLIPREVMVNLGLNRLEKEEEIQRYQFKRLLASAKNIYLIYQQGADKEKSRFIEELIWERQKEAGTIGALPVPQASFKVNVLPKALLIAKKPQVIDFLRAREYSASSVNTYIHCPLRFYYQYVLGLKEKEDLLEEPEGADIGTFIHELLHETFRRFIGNKPRIDDAFTREFFQVFERKFSQEFERKMKSDAFLIKEILTFRLGRFLENEKQRNVQRVIGLESTFKSSIPLSPGRIKFQAVIDRIDVTADGNILVLDYKTGSADILPSLDEHKARQAVWSRLVIKHTLKSIQLPLYLFLVEENKEYKRGSTNACLYLIKELGKDHGLRMLFKNEAQLLSKNKIMEAYLSALDFIIGEIFDPAVAFKADEEDRRYCEYCPFVYLCR